MYHPNPYRSTVPPPTTVVWVKPFDGGAALLSKHSDNGSASAAGGTMSVAPAANSSGFVQITRQGSITLAELQQEFGISSVLECDSNGHVLSRGMVMESPAQILGRGRHYIARKDHNDAVAASTANGMGSRVQPARQQNMNQQHHNNNNSTTSSASIHTSSSTFYNQQHRTASPLMTSLGSQQQQQHHTKSNSLMRPPSAAMMMAHSQQQQQQQYTPSAYSTPLQGPRGGVPRGGGMPMGAVAGQQQHGYGHGPFGEKRPRDDYSVAPSSSLLPSSIKAEGSSSYHHHHAAAHGPPPPPPTNVRRKGVTFQSKVFVKEYNVGHTIDGHSQSFTLMTAGSQSAESAHNHNQNGGGGGGASSSSSMHSRSNYHNNTTTTDPPNGNGNIIRGPHRYMTSNSAHAASYRPIAAAAAMMAAAAASASSSSSSAGATAVLLGPNSAVTDPAMRAVVNSVAVPREWQWTDVSAAIGQHNNEVCRIHHLVDPKRSAAVAALRAEVESFLAPFMEEIAKAKCDDTKRAVAAPQQRGSGGEVGDRMSAVVDPSTSSCSLTIPSSSMVLAEGRRSDEEGRSAVKLEQHQHQSRPSSVVA